MSELEFDASQPILAFDDLAEAMQRYSLAGGRIVSVTKKMNDVGDVYQATLKAMSQTGEKLSATFTELEGQTVKLSESLQTGGKTMSEFRNELALNRRALAKQRVQEAKDEQEARQSKLDKDQKQYDQILNAALDHYNKEHQAHLKYVADFERGNELAEQIRQENQRHEDEHMQHTLDNQRRLADRLTGANNVQRGLQSGVSYTNASPAEIQNHANAIGRITELVQQGAVSQVRAQQIVQEVTRGTGQVYLGAERQVATAVNGMMSATAKLGAAHRQQQQQIASSAGDSAKAYGRAMHSMANDGEASATRLFITWDTLVRFLQFRIVYSMGFAIAGALKQGAEAVREFEIRISEIRTLSQDTDISFQGWTKTVLSLSNAFGFAAQDVAKGVYETLSNQIAKGAEATRFLKDAMEFSLVTVSSTADAVNLLSSAINSYGTTAAETQRIAAVLFRTIDLGRVTASEMANTFGRVAALSATAGVSFEELNAGIATLTIQGIKYNEAYTLINNVMLKLIKPSEAMSAMFKRWGVESGTAALSTFGFVGVIRKLKEETGGSATELAELFKEMRAFRGVSGFVNMFDQYEATLSKMTTESIPKYRAALTIAMESSGRIVEIELNKLKNYFMMDWGKSINDALAGKSDKAFGLQPTIASMISMFGGLSKSLSAIINGFKYLAAGLVVYKIHSTAAAISTRLNTQAIALNTAITERGGRVQIMFGKSFGTVSKEMLAMRGAANTVTSVIKSLISMQTLFVAATIAAIAFYDNYQERQEEIRSAGEKWVTEFEKQNDEMTKIGNDAYTQRVRIVEDGINAEFRARSQAIAGLRADTTAALDIAKEQVKAHAKIIKDIFEVQINLMHAALAKLEQRGAKAGENAKRAIDLASGISDEAALNQEKLGLKGLSPENELAKRAQLMQHYRDAGANLLAQAAATTDPEQVERLMNEGAKSYKKAYEYLDSILSKRNEIEGKIKDAQDNLKELGAKGGNRDAIEAQQAEIRRLEEVRRKATELSKKNPSDPRVLAARKAVEAAEAKAAAMRGGQADVGDAGRAAALATELGNLTLQLNAVNGIGDANKIVAEMYAEQEKILKRIAELQNQQKAKVDDQVRKEKERIAQLQTVLGQIASFEIDKKAKTPEDVTKSMAKFDEMISQATTLGLTDQNAILELQKYRVRLARQADLEIKNNRLASLEEDLEAEKKKLLKFQTDLTAGRTQAKDLVTANIKSLGDTTGLMKMLEAVSKDTRIEGSPVGFDQVEGGVNRATQNVNLVDLVKVTLKNLEVLSNGQEVISQLLAREKQLGTSGAPLDKLELENVQRDRLSRQNVLATTNPELELQKLSQAVILLQRNLNLIGKGAGVFGGDRPVDIGGEPVDAIIGRIAATVTNTREAFKQQEAITARQKEYEQMLSQHNVTLEQAIAVQRESTELMRQFGGEFNTAIKEAGENLRNLNFKFKDTADKLDWLLMHPGQPVQPVSMTFPTPVPSQLAPSNNGAPITIGDIVVYNQSSGNAAVDGRAIATSLRNEIRTGAIAPLA